VSTDTDGRPDPLGSDHVLTHDGEVPDTAPVVEIQPPHIQSSRLGNIGLMWRNYRLQKKRKKMARKGYVEWYLVDSTWPRPKYVKPETGKGNVPKITHKGTEYLFPRSALAPSERTGMWTAVHVKGQADPINVTEPHELGLPADVLTEMVDLEISAQPPGLLERLDLDPKTIIAGMMALVVIFAVFSGGF
jgi:hypothetical protein